jgi:hypothetical protein
MGISAVDWASVLLWFEIMADFDPQVHKPERALRFAVRRVGVGQEHCVGE